MRSLEDDEVQALAVNIREGGAVLPWPRDYAAQLGVPAHVCAMVDVQGENVMVALNEDHTCTQPDRVMLHVAAVVLAFLEDGPDAGWQSYQDGTGHQTFVSEADPTAQEPDPEPS